MSWAKVPVIVRSPIPARCTGNDFPKFFAKGPDLAKGFWSVFVEPATSLEPLRKRECPQTLEEVGLVHKHINPIGATSEFLCTGDGKP